MNQDQSKNRLPKNNSLSRRNFLGRTATAAAAFTIIPRSVMGGKGYTAPSDTVNVAGIGIGSQGGGDIQQICSPDVPIERPARNSNCTPMTKEHIAERQARMAEMQKRMAANAPGGAGRQPDPNATVQMGDAQRGRVIKLANIYALCDVDL